MGLVHRAYAIDSAPDWDAVAAEVERSLGERVRAEPLDPGHKILRAPWIGGAAQVGYGGGRIESEASFGTNPFFLEHLDRALVAAGATPTHPSTAAARALTPWKEAPLRTRLAQGLVGQAARAVLFLALSPILLLGLVFANVFVLARKWVRAARTP